MLREVESVPLEQFGLDAAGFGETLGAGVFPYGLGHAPHEEIVAQEALELLREHVDRLESLRLAEFPELAIPIAARNASKVMG